ncbi:polyprenol reductase isoform X2 [Hypomesus transpacificus]|uniref:polyprenol reductase isoform X2 n=1 Tax=Hypomesus transpacificus TaxID=137520 RepID=UPI001F08034D|nr:polyprenol reductase isoform X2 [Hypomesus transpacificus]
MSVGLNVIETTWLLLGILFFLAVSIHTISLYLPYECEKFQAFILFQDLIRYGKTKKSKRDTWLRVFDIPKRWFWHFYAVSVLWNGLLVVVSLRAIQWDEPYPPWLTDTLSFLAGSSATHGQAPHVCSVAVQVLVWIHCLRRLAECLYVSVFSDGVIHVVQYVFGLGYYILLGLTVLCWDRNTEGKEGPVPPVLTQLGVVQAAGVLLFAWASLLQHRSLITLAHLRTGASGAVETLAHRVPSGGWFELVSCPHYLAELLIYASLSLVSGGVSLTWWLVVLYVLFNQMLAALLCHQFYRSKFESYPQHRKALIPFIL